MEQWELDLIAKVRDLARGPWTERAARHDREGSFPRENLDELQALKVPAMALAPAIGGLGISPEAQMRVMEEVAYGDGSTAVALNMHVLVAGFLESMPPTFAEAVAGIAAGGESHVAVVPLFLAQGGHLREDIPNLIAGARKRHPELEFRQLPPLGEAPEVLEAIADWIHDCRP